MNADQVIDTFFGTQACRMTSANAQSMPGSPEHVAYAKHAALLTKAWEGDYLALTSDLTNAALKYFATTRMRREMQISVVRDVVPHLVGCAWWSSIGSPVFNLTLDFFRAIRITDFGDAGTEPVNNPYPTYLVRFPEPLKDGIRTGFLYPVPSVTGEETIRALDFQVSRLSLAAPIVDGDKSAVRQAYTQWPNALSFNEFLNATPHTMEEADVIERVTTELMGTEMDPEATKQARRVLGNTLLYINSSGGLPSEKRTGPDIPIEREHGVAPRFRIGRPIKLGPKVRDALDPSRTGPTWTLEQRFVVRGHWRNQAYGPSASLRRKQWIQPFWKGPDDITEAMQRTFEVD